jgi:4-hydroxyphenylpyruvate dioxygenase
MGPYPHDAPPAMISAQNPMGTDGFAFVSFADPHPVRLHALFAMMGFVAVARHRRRPITAYRQGDITFLVDDGRDGHAARFAAAHGPSVPAIGFRVADAAHAHRRALALGAEDAPEGSDLGWPAIRGIGGALLYLVDRDAPWRDWDGLPAARPPGVGLFYIDHLTHNVGRGRMDHWSAFYARLFNFRQIRYFSIEGRMTGLVSRALASPDGRIRIPINESADERSQIAEYLRDYRGEGVQHVALGCRDIHASVEALRAAGLGFMPAPPATYYETVDARLPGHGEELSRLARNGILIDGETAAGEPRARLLLQVFSRTVIGPVFFEFIERKGDEGFGEGNFRALFESIEADQIRRGVLTPAAE